jgi:hypothetical protein
METPPDIEMEGVQPPAPPTVAKEAKWRTTNWVWRDENKKHWIAAPEDQQHFMDYWMNVDQGKALNQNIFPHTLAIFPSSGFKRPDDVMSEFAATPLLHTSEGTILVLERYALLYHGLDDEREGYYKSGIIVGGQPGIGTLGA